MAMRYPKSIVLSGALSALFMMTDCAKLDIEEAYKQCNYSSLCIFWAAITLCCLEVRFKSFAKEGNGRIEKVEEKLEAGQGKTAVRQFFSRFCTPIFLELAAHKNAVRVATAATIGHTICTSLAVVGGSMLASKISQSTVAIVGGLVLHCLHIFILRYNHNFVD